MMTFEPTAELTISENTNLHILCQGRTDDATDLIVEWRFNGGRFYPDPPHTSILADNTVEIDTNDIDDDNKWKDYAGRSYSQTKPASKNLSPIFCFMNIPHFKFTDVNLIPLYIHLVS